MAPFRQDRDVVIGSGPNGLAAAIMLARAGRRVVVYEAEAQIGGGARSMELTLPGFVHDLCSAVHPMAVSSPCLDQFPLASHGLEWIHPDAPLAHPLDDGSAVMLERSVDATARNLGGDGGAWRRLMEPLASRWGDLRRDVLAAPRLPRHPLLMARFGLHAIRSARSLAYGLFREERARALWAGLAAHSVMPLEAPASGAIGLALGAAGHAAGWPIPRRGSQRITDALAAYFCSLGGEIVAGMRIDSLPPVPLILCDTTPRQLAAMAGDRLPERYRAALLRYRYGPGVFKMDFALDGPIPWRAPECLRSATVHLGGTFDEVAAWEANFVGRPFVLLAQPGLFDSTRAPAGKHTVWAYCHVPNASTADMSSAIESQIERFAPGFRERILARSVMTPADVESHNANLIGGDIAGGANDLRQLFLRPTARLYSTPLRGVFLCSASTPPGGGVHGMCGYYAARAALKALPSTNGRS
jgi:phytoene dehydrogenase-like protein